MKSHSLVLLLFISATNTFAQILTPRVISPSGGFYASNSGLLSFTIGELTSVETYTAPSSILTQGFQQAWDFGTLIDEHSIPDFSFGIYPNPTDEIMYLVTDTEKKKRIEIKILDVLGRGVLHTTYLSEAKINIHPINVSVARPGTYILTLSVKENNSSPSYHFCRKFQIIR